MRKNHKINEKFGNSFESVKESIKLNEHKVNNYILSKTSNALQTANVLATNKSSSTLKKSANSIAMMTTATDDDLFGE